jgi:hypothetical protein
MRSIDVVVRELCIAIAEAQQQKAMTQPAGSAAASSGAAPAADSGPRRSRRAQFKADGTGEPEPAASGS